MSKKQLTSIDEPRTSRRGRHVANAVWLLVGLAGANAAYAAGITIEPADGPVSFAGFTMDLDCDDLVVNGTLDINGATFQKVGNVIIGAGGSLTATNANIEATFSWQNNGSFSGAGSTVTPSNACANTSTSFSGNTTFHNFSATSPGLTLNFAGGTEQQVAGALTLINQTLQGQGASTYLTLLPGGTQNITTVGVSNVNASRGQRLAPTQMNQIGQGYAPNWFRNASSIVSGIAPVPTTSTFGLSLLGLLLGGAALWNRRGKKNKPL